MAEEVVVEAGEETVETPAWAEGIADEGLKGVVSKFETSEAFLEAAGIEAPKAPEPADWRASIADEDAKKFAESSTDINHLVKRAMDLRKQVSTAIIKPGKDATDDQIVAYHKALGIPETPDGYEFPPVPEAEMTDEIKANQASWAGRFHELGVSQDAAKGLMAAVAEEAAQHAAAAVEADKAFVKAQEDALRAEWKGEDYDKNKTLANRAFAEIANRAGVTLEQLTQIETKDGRFLMDRADMVRLFGVIGREMAEGSLGPAMSSSERETVDDAVRDIRAKIQEAQEKGDSKRANQLYTQEQALLAKMGDAPIVGAAGRAA